ncbi:Ff.00g066830.m01.CDS01 [Fusarium sp. VM40]|nr:Ff.00g066830.m01.CDS01 [Fusarium sp. VM40]
MSSLDIYVGDDWPRMRNGTNWDGQNLFELLRKAESPFSPVWDANLLFDEVEDKVGAKVIDVPCVHTGANNYGIHLRLLDQRDVLARLGNADVNMPLYGGFNLRWLHKQVDFEADTNNLLRNDPNVPTDCLLFYRHPIQHYGENSETPKDISGRRLMIFEMAKGEVGAWATLGQQQRGFKMSTLTDAARIRAALLHLDVPSQFVSDWLLWRTFQPEQWMPTELPLPIGATRDFWLAAFKTRIVTMIKEEGDILGWPRDKVIIGRKALDTKEALLRLIPIILPHGDEAVLYRPVLQHNDFGVHNILNDIIGLDHTRITSVFDWETGSIVPFLFSEITFSIAGCDLILDENGEASVHIRSKLAGEPKERVKNQAYSTEFRKIIKENTPHLEEALQAGKYARYLWIKLKQWKGQDPEDFFGRLGEWAQDLLSKYDLGKVSNL